MGSEDKLNLSVEVVNSSKIISKGNGGNGPLDTSNNNLKLSRITEEKMNISVDGIQNSSRGHNLNEKSVIADSSPGMDDDKSKRKDD